VRNKRNAKKQAPAKWLPPRACANCGVSFFTQNDGQTRCERCKPIAKQAARVAARAQRKWKKKMAEVPSTPEQAAHMREIMQ